MEWDGETSDDNSDDEYSGDEVSGASKFSTWIDFVPDLPRLTITYPRTRPSLPAIFVTSAELTASCFVLHRETAKA